MVFRLWQTPTRGLLHGARGPMGTSVTCRHSWRSWSGRWNRRRRTWRSCEPPKRRWNSRRGTDPSRAVFYGVSLRTYLQCQYFSGAPPTVKETSRPSHFHLPPKEALDKQKCVLEFEKILFRESDFQDKESSLDAPQLSEESGSKR